MRVFDKTVRAIIRENENEIYLGRIRRMSWRLDGVAKRDRTLSRDSPRTSSSSSPYSCIMRDCESGQSGTLVGAARWPRAAFTRARGSESKNKRTQLPLLRRSRD